MKQIAVMVARTQNNFTAFNSDLPILHILGFRTSRRKIKSLHALNWCFGEVVFCNMINFKHFLAHSELKVFFNAFAQLSILLHKIIGKTLQIAKLFGVGRIAVNGVFYCVRNRERI